MKPKGENLVENAMQIKIPLQKQGNGMVAAVTRNRLQFFVPCNDYCGRGGGWRGGGCRQNGKHSEESIQNAQ